ncbi:MAG: preprotein translocase subunit YajC [Planctomycetota bacterium]|nr:preprotein translocase subunit YajC [Planctomycetota bacterium]
MFSSLASLSFQLTPFLAAIEEPPTEQPAFPWMSIVLIGGLAWFLLIAPEKKIRKERTAMLNALKKNDSVVTNGGLYGVITRLDDESVTLRVDKDVHVRVQRGAVAGLPNANQEEAKESAAKSETEDK